MTTQLTSEGCGFAGSLNGLPGFLEHLIAQVKELTRRVRELFSRQALELAVLFARIERLIDHPTLH